MKNISITLASVLSIAFTIPIVDKAISKPTKSQLPKVGIIKNIDTYNNSGCYYWQSNEANKKSEIQLKKLEEKQYKNQSNSSLEDRQTATKLAKALELQSILVDVSDEPTMNLNGRDTILRRVSKHRNSAGKNNEVIYKVDKTVIKISTKQTWGSSAVTTDITGTMSINNSREQKTIKIKGNCWID